NTSMIKPNWRGPLSCALVNFSAFPVSLRPGSQIARICFHRLSPPVSPEEPDIQSGGEYKIGLCKDASKLPRSFLQLDDVDPARLAEQAKVLVLKALKTEEIAAEAGAIAASS